MHGWILILAGIVAGLAMEASAVKLFLEAKSHSLGFLCVLLAIHVAACSLFSFQIYAASTRLKYSSPKNWLLASLMSTLVFPVAGIVCMFVLFLYTWVLPGEKTGAYEEYEKYITYDFEPEEKYMPSDKLLQGIGEELEVTPLVEVLAEESANARRGVMNVIGKLPKKDAIRLLKIALNDKSVEVRYLAASELSKIEAEFNENVFMARKETLRNPDSADAHLALANAYAEYFESGFLDDFASRYYMDLAAEEYRVALRMGGENIQILNYLANLDLLSSRYEDAYAKFKRVTEADPGNVYAHVGLINTYYEKGEVGHAIRHAKETIGRMPPSQGIMREIVGYWAS